MIEKNEESELAEKVLNKLMENNKLETVAKALINIIINENSSDKECQIDINPDEMVKLFINVGKKDKIMVKDIVGSILANTAISGENIGKINILDKFTFVEIHGKYVNEILNSMKGKQIKGRDVNIEIANS